MRNSPQKAAWLQKFPQTRFNNLKKKSYSYKKIILQRNSKKNRSNDGETMKEYTEKNLKTWYSEIFSYSLQYKVLYSFKAKFRGMDLTMQKTLGSIFKPVTHKVSVPNNLEACWKSTTIGKIPFGVYFKIPSCGDIGKTGPLDFHSHYCKGHTNQEKGKRKKWRFGHNQFCWLL